MLKRAKNISKPTQNNFKQFENTQNAKNYLKLLKIAQKALKT